MVRLTHAGQVFVACARRVPATVQKTVAEIAALDGDVRGQLRLDVLALTAADLDMLGLLREFQTTYPAVEVMVFDAGCVAAASQVLTDELEMAVLALRSTVPRVPCVRHCDVQRYRAKR